MSRADHVLFHWRPVALFAATFCLAVAAMGASAPRAQAPPNVLVMAQSAEPKSLDPHLVTALNDFRICTNIYDGLVRFRSGTLQIEPALAHSWDIAPDGMTYTFHLRRNVRFQDGAPFDAEAVKFNFERMLDEDHPFHNTGPFPLSFLFESIESIDVVDTHTVRFTLKEPFAPFLSNLAYPTGFMVSPSAVERHGKTFGRQPVGTGPFRFVRWESGTSVVLERNPDYWQKAPPLETAVFRPIKDDNTRAAALLAGDVDVLVEVPADTIEVFRAQPTTKVLEETGPHLWFLILNTRHGPFKDQRMRQAVNLAINKKALVENVLQGSAVIADGPVPRAFAWAHDPELKPYPYDPERAAKLIEDAGYKDVSMTLLAAEGGSGMLQPVAMATAIQADLAKVGLKVEIQTLEWNTYLKRVNSGLDEADMAEMAWMTNDPDTLPYLALRSEAMPDKGGFNSGYYANPKVDDLIQRARETTDRKERAKLYRQLQRVVHEDAPWAFIANWRQAVAFLDGISGLNLEPSFLLDLRDVSKPQ